LSTCASPDAPILPDVAPPGRPASGLNFYVARTLGEVLEAWGVVYQAYRRDGLIDENPYGIHTTPHAVNTTSAVVFGCIGPVPVGTISAYADGPDGLPLDTVYNAELQALRAQGRKLVEVGLFADRREHMSRSSEGLFELMRFGFNFGLYRQADDIVIGVHPRHAPFYMRFVGFEQIGQVRRYPTVKDRAVVLLRLDLHACIALDPRPKALAYFLENPVPAPMFDRRFRFDDPAMANSAIAQFLATRPTTIEPTAA
jgi:hypothetical protein